MKRIYIDGKIPQRTMICCQWKFQRYLIKLIPFFSLYDFFLRSLHEKFLSISLLVYQLDFQYISFPFNIKPQESGDGGWFLLFPILCLLHQTILFYSSENTTAIFDYLMADHVHSNSRDSVNLSLFLSLLLTRARKWKRFNE